MLVLESSRFNLNLDNNHEEEDRERKKKKSSSLLMMMVNKDGSSTMIVEDIEEGEISDESQSVEEISAEDFKQQEISSSSSAAAATTTTKEVAVSSKPLNSKSTSTSTSAREDSNSRVWMGDVYKYPVSSNYGGSGLYNFAWAQAVQNKPLSEGLMREFENNNNNNNNNRDVENNGLNNNRSSSNTKSKDIVCDVIIEDSSSEEIDSNKVDADDEELEEGEIELDSENCQRTPPHTTTSSSSSSSIDSKDNNKDEDDDLQKRLKLIKQTLEIVTLNDAHKSFDGVCSRLQTSLDNFQVIVSKSAVSEELGALLDRTFAGIQALHSVYNSMNSKQQEQNKDNLSRLLARVKSQVPALFSSEQMKKIQIAKDSLDSPSVSSSVKDMEVDEELRVNTGVKIELGILGEKHRLVNSSEKGLLEPISTKFGNQNNSVGSEILKQGVLSGNRGRMSFGPLLDLHRDHDVDSLPSPTREAPPPLNFRERQATDDGNVKSESIPKVANKSDETSLHSYETDAVKAVSSYQQKFSRTSFLLSSRLPSPTPSEESDGGGDCNGEVSSSSMIRNVTAVNPPMPLQFIGSVAPQMDKSTGQGPVLAKTMEQMASVPIPHTRASSKSRDPRLRLANLDAGPSDPKLHPLLRGTPKTEPVEGIITSRKNKNAEETLMDGQALKKQKLGLTNCEVSSDVQMARGSGWLENCSTARTPVGERIQSAESMGTDPRKLEIEAILSGQRLAISSGPFIAKTVGNDQLPVPVVGSSTTPSLSSLLKDIIVNPTMLVQLIMEQQRLAAEAQNSSSLLQSSTPAFTSNITPGTPLVNIGPSKSYDIQQKTEEKTPVLSETTSANPQSEWGKVRMKPRDPRRILHSSTIKKNESLGSEQFKMNGALQPSSQASTDNVSVRQQSEHAQTTTLPSQFSPPPDIARQFTKNLRNLADILSSQSTDSVSTVTHGGSSSQMIPVRAENADVGVSITDPKNHQSGTVMTPEGVTEASQSQNTWGDVEHLFEGYDDKQKAAIQRERARRIEEQNKMFAAKKLCLVLDLDHTLLNSAKFVEVEPVHEEILRKKEEQDREKPQRHLFRFYHMGMWTKLRPGIWTFLEKASKLYELHLYTMGNKLYATEMAKVLDPTGALFAGRVISKGDDGDPFDSDEKLPKSKDLEGVLGMESAVVIIDDSVKVWPHNKLNLILVERYTYFPCSRRQFGLPGPSLLEIDHDERPEDGTLASSLAVIERLHQNFFSNPSLHEVDIRNILASEQRKILSGCRIVFSRIFPVGEAKPHQHPLWQTAEQFGAVCTTQIDNLVTHVVANSLGTDKVNWALSTGRFVVHPGWVEASALLYRRASEQDFAVKINLP